MKKIFTLVILFVAISYCADAQVAGDSTARIQGSLQLNMKALPKRDQTLLTSAEQTTITNYINSLGTRVRSFTFIGNNFYVDPMPDLDVLDIMEGIKEKGISLMYINGHQMFFVNDDLKIETWSVK